MSEPAQGIRRAAAGGVMWTASSQGFRQVLQVGVTAVLARNLAAGDFGLVAMTAVTLAFLAPFNELGLGAALVQRKIIAPGHMTTVFWCQILMACGTALVLTLAAPLIAGFFKQDNLVTLLQVMCWNLPIGAAASTPQALLLRNLKFGRVAVVETVALAGSGAIAVTMALTGWGVWSLVAQAISGAVITTVMLMALAGFNPFSIAARPRLVYLKDVIGFSAPLAGYQILNFASRNIDNILIGKFLGAEALGYYSMAYRVMMYPLQKVSGVVGRVTFPTFSMLRDDLPRIRRGYVKTAQYIALLTFPMMTCLMLVAPEFTLVLFGPAWDPVAPLITVLALAGMSGSIGTTVGNIFLARGRSDLLLKWEIFASICYVTVISAALPWGLMGVAVGYTAMALILWPISHWVANRLIDLSLSDFYRALVPPAVLAAIVAVVLLLVRSVWNPVGFTEELVFLLSCGGLSALAYVVAALTGVPAGVNEMIGLVREMLPWRRTTPRAGATRE